MLVTPNASSYAVIPNPRGISLPGAFTIEFWALSSSFAPHAGLIEQANNGDTGAFSIGFTSGDSLGVSLRLNTGVTNLATPNIADIQLWNHYAVTFTPGDSIRIFVNGIQITSKKTNAANLTASSDSIFIAYSELSKVVFTGNMDELRIWSVARTGAQILAAMKSSLSGKEAGLKAYYSFDDDPSTPNIHDFTGGRSDGAILSAAMLAASTSPVTGTTASYMLASKEAAIVFPELICGNQTDTIIRIFNRGQQTVQIDPVGFRFGTVFSASIIGFPLPPDSTHLGIIHIQANASKPGLYRDTLIVKSTTVCGGILLIPVELTVGKIAIAFQDSLFDLHSNLLPCNLPIESQTFLKNTGTRTVTINPLSFSVAAGIAITSPTTSFAIAAGASQEIKFTVLPDVSGPINTTLTASTTECSVSAQIVFKGKRVDPRFSIPDHIQLPTVHLPPTPTAIDTTIYLKNTGTSNLSMNPPLALLGSPGFRILSPLLAFIKPDSSFAIKIRFTTSRECGTFETSLHIQDQLDCSIDTLIPISITVLGPDVSASDGIFDLGANCGSHDTTIFIVNRSGLPIVLGKPNFNIDSVLFLQSGVLPKALDPGDSVPITLRFSPAEPGTYGVNAHFGLYPCGDLNIHFKGTMGVGLIRLSDTTLNFWTGCDLSTEARKITITNQCGRAITVTDTTSSGSHAFAIISPALPFALANSESKVITVKFTPELLGSLERGSIALFDSGCFVTRFNVRGVRERLTVQSSPSIAEFGTVCPGRIGTVGLSLQNLGYGDDTVTFYRIVEKGTSVFTATNAAGAVITHGNSRQFTVTFSPLDTGEFLGILELVFAPCDDTMWIPLHGIGGPPAALSLSTDVLDFGTIRFGSSDSLCVVLQNPSCIKLPISADSLHFVKSAFSLLQSSLDRLPGSVDDNDPLTLCFGFVPDSIGSFESTADIVIGDQRKLITLRGSAGISDLTFDSTYFDFGDVLRDQADTLSLTIANVGTFPASLAIGTLPAPDFTITPNAQTIGGKSSRTDEIIFKPSTLGLQVTSAVFNWENHSQTIYLRGRGILPGLQFPSSLLEFGKVRVADSSTLSIDVINNLDLDNVVIDSVSITGKFSVLPLGIQTVGPHKSISYAIKYKPDAEMIDTGTFVIHTQNSGDALLPLHGQGIQAHLVVSARLIDFGDVGLGQIQYYDLKISDSGEYPLTITDISRNATAFGIGSTSMLIPPQTTIDYILSFAPPRAIQFSDSLHITADAPEKNTSVALRGKGVFQPLGIPEVSYSIPDEFAKVGDILEIPISISGSDLPLFDLDSFFVELSYDPSVVFFHNFIDTARTLSSGFTMKFERLAHDSIIRISGTGKTIIPSPGRLFVLRAEALLGPHDSTRIVVQSSDPKNTADLLSSSGAFIVTDCGNYRGGVVAKGNYSVSSVTPNPAATIAHIDYELGLTGRVHLDLYDLMGKHIRTLIDEDVTKGKHSALFNTDGIPSGEYVYIFKSLEYESRGAMIIEK